jgi:hypothetical protein
MVQRFIELRQVRSFDQVLSTTFAFLRTTFRPLFRSLLTIAGPFLLAGGMSGSLSITYLAGAFSNDSIGALLAFFFGIVLLLTACLFMFTATYAFIILYVRSHGVPPSPGEVWRLTRKSLLRMIGTVIVLALLTGLVEVAIAAVAGFIILIAGDIISALLTFCLFLAGVYVAVNISLIFIIRMQEPIGIFDALNRCFALVRHHWWQTFGVVSLMYIILFMITYTSSILPFTFVMVQDIVTADSGSGIVYSILTVVTAILSLFFFLATSSLFNISVAVQYYNLVERKEAPGLRERVAGLESQDGTEPEVQP